MINTTLWTALITPMTHSGEVHYDDLEKLIRRQESAGNGVLLIGSTGEGLALSDSEKQNIVEFADQMKPDVPVMVGVGGFQIEEQKQWIEFCNSKSIDALLLVAPLYAKPGPEGQRQWFNELLNVSEKPCMIYNIPSRTGVEIEPAVLADLQSHPNFWSVKEASGNIKDYQRFREVIPNIPLYSGDDGLMPFFATAGSAGLVSVASNVWPEETAEYVKLCLNGETNTLFPVWKLAAEALFSAPNPIPAKTLLNEKGIIETNQLRLPLVASEIENRELLTETDTKILNWYKKIKN